MPDEERAPLDRLPDDAVVVRGGLMLPADLVVSAQSHFDAEGFYALSVYCVPGMTADEIAVGAKLSYSKVRVSTVGRIRSMGYNIVGSPGPPGHADLVLPTPPTDHDWTALERVFDPPGPNPATMRLGDV
jgi:hypothetical protein